MKTYLIAAVHMITGAQSPATLITEVASQEEAQKVFQDSNTLIKRWPGIWAAKPVWLPKKSYLQSNHQEVKRHEKRRA